MDCVPSVSNHNALVTADIDNSASPMDLNSDILSCDDDSIVNWLEETSDSELSSNTESAPSQIRSSSTPTTTPNPPVNVQETPLLQRQLNENESTSLLSTLLSGSLPKDSSFYLIFDTQFAMYQGNIYPREFCLRVLHYCVTQQSWQTINTSHGCVSVPISYSRLSRNDMRLNQFLTEQIHGIYWESVIQNDTSKFSEHNFKQLLRDIFKTYPDIRIILRGKQKSNYLVQKLCVDENKIHVFMRNLDLKNVQLCSRHIFNFPWIRRCSLFNVNYITSCLMTVK